MRLLGLEWLCLDLASRYHLSCIHHFTAATKQQRSQRHIPTRCCGRQLGPDGRYPRKASFQPDNGLTRGAHRVQEAVQIAANPQQASTLEKLRTPQAAAIVGIAVLSVFGLRAAFGSGSRAYTGQQTVGAEYDAWTNEGILETYWGEHIHLGYYTEEERRRGYKKKNFKQAKIDFCDEMLAWAGATSPQRILDVGCGFGGTSRHLGKKFRDASIEGITLSPAQVQRGTQLAQEQGITNVNFQVMNALSMTWPNNSFDLVWACESGEHMPDKKQYVEEMTRVLKPGGTLVIATWCQREATPDNPFTEAQRQELDFLYTEWAHPFFVSIQEYGRLMQATGKLEQVETADWTRETINSWRHSIWVGVYNPWPVIAKLNPMIWYKTVREIVTLERMHRAFDSGLMQYGMMKAVKKAD